MRLEVKELTAAEYSSLTGLVVSASTAPFLPYALRVSEDGDVLVAMMDLPRIKAMGDRRREYDAAMRGIETAAREKAEREREERNRWLAEASELHAEKKRQVDEAYREKAGIGKF